MLCSSFRSMIAVSPWVLFLTSYNGRVIMGKITKRAIIQETTILDLHGFHAV